MASTSMSFVAMALLMAAMLLAGGGNTCHAARLLADVPALPEPTLPTLPPVPVVPTVPAVPGGVVPTVPTLPTVPEVPTVPGQRTRCRISPSAPARLLHSAAAPPAGCSALAPPRISLRPSASEVRCLRGLRPDRHAAGGPASVAPPMSRNADSDSRSCPLGLAVRRPRPPPHCCRRPSASSTAPRKPTNSDSSRSYSAHHCCCSPARLADSLRH
ncbi:hypothetical protein ZWY2020_017873 [Hordeum vulgare]|nr:hypothetical protein ZWY2020_017873 [Hordeum vulgare]